MIDRKAFWISSALIFVMLMAAFWRVTQLGQLGHWMQLPRFGEDGAPIQPINSLVLLVQPGMLFFVVVSLAMRGWMAKASDEALQPWKKCGAFSLVAPSVIVTLLQFNIIARSFGFLLSVSPILVVRGCLVVVGLLTVVISNSIPKLPWLASRIGILDLSSESGAKLLRFRGRMGVLFGLVAIFCALLLPFSTIRPLILTMALAGIAVGLLFRFQLKRNQPQ
jgi:hypothetical protein